jgi:hypothetical protein
MAKMDYRKARSQSGDSYRWSAPSLNTGRGPGKSTKTPDEIKTIRRQFLINCVRAELRGERYPGVPRVLKGTDLLLRGSATAILRMWIEQQPDLQEAIDWVRERDASKAQPAR